VKVIYIAGPYRDEYEYRRFENLLVARSAALTLWNLGVVPVVPHLLTFTLAGIVPEGAFLEGLKSLLAHCDAVYFLPGWDRSEGCRKEYDFATERGIPKFFYLVDLSEWLKKEERRQSHADS